MRAKPRASAATNRVSGPHVARVDEEAHAGEQRRPGQNAGGRAEQARPQPGGRPHGDQRGEGRHQARGALRLAPDGEAHGHQRVEQRRLVDVADAVQGEGERIAREGELARDLRVHPLAGIVERRAPEPEEHEGGGQRHGQRDRAPRGSRGSGRARGSGAARPSRPGESASRRSEGLANVRQELLLDALVRGGHGFVLVDPEDALALEDRALDADRGAIARPRP